MGLYIRDFFNKWNRRGNGMTGIVLQTGHLNESHWKKIFWLKPEMAEFFAGDI